MACVDTGTADESEEPRSHDAAALHKQHEDDFGKGMADPRAGRDDLLGALEAPRLLDTAVERLKQMGFSLEDICAEGALPAAELRGILDRTSDTRPRLEL